MSIETRVKALLTALQTIHDGSSHTGLWRDPDGTECDEDDPGASWEEFTQEEQSSWLYSVSETAKDALAAFLDDPAAVAIIMHAGELHDLATLVAAGDQCASGAADLLRKIKGWKIP